MFSLYSFSKSQTTNLTRTIANNGMSDIGGLVALDDEDITVVQSREKTKARLAEEEKDHTKFEKRKAFLDEATNLQKERIEARETDIKSFWDNLTPEQQMSHKGLKELAEKYGI